MLRLLSHDEIMAALRALPDASQRPLPGLSAHQTKAFDMLHQRDPGMFQFITGLAAKGSQTAREAVTTELAQILRVVLELVTNPDKTKVLNWEEACNRAAPLRKRLYLRNEIVLKWNYYNVAHEAGSDQNPFKYNLSNIKFMEKLQSALHTQTVDDVHCRGISALFLSTDREWTAEDDTIARSSRFIDWAGRHENISAVISVAHERNILDVDTIRYFLEETNSHSALGSGTL